MLLFYCVILLSLCGFSDATCKITKLQSRAFPTPVNSNNNVKPHWTRWHASFVHMVTIYVRVDWMVLLQGLFYSVTRREEVVRIRTHSTHSYFHSPSMKGTKDVKLSWKWETLGDSELTMRQGEHLIHECLQLAPDKKKNRPVIPQYCWLSLLISQKLLVNRL